MGANLRCEIFPFDLDATVDFYVRVLGFDLVWDERPAEEPYLAFARDDVQIGASQRVAPDVDLSARRPPVGVELVIEVDDLDRCFDRVVDAGWPVEALIMRRPWGLRDFRLTGPTQAGTTCASPSANPPVGARPQTSGDVELRRSGASAAAAFSRNSR